MAKNKSIGFGFKVPDELVTQRQQLAASGASGVHADQKARRHRAGVTNRIGTRSARRRAAIRNDNA